MMTFMAVTALCLGLLYAYVYPLGYPKITGLTYERVTAPAGVLALRGGVDVISIFVATLAMFLVLARLGGRRVMAGVLLTNLALLGIAGWCVARDAKQVRNAPVQSEQPIRFSKKDPNVLIVFLDRLMGGFIEGILERRPQLAEQLDGFVWYPRSVAPGQNSVAGIHAMLGGYDYTPTEMNERVQPLRAMTVESFAILPHNFTRKGYAVTLLGPRGLGFTRLGDCSFLAGIEGLNCTQFPLTMVPALAKQVGIPLGDVSKALYGDLLSLHGLMRGIPYVSKAILFEQASWPAILDHSAGTTFKEWADLKSLAILSSSKAERSTLNVVFNLLPHEPYYMGEDCLPQGREFKVPKEEFLRRGHQSLFSLQHQIAAECSLLLVADYFKWMKEEGVYDNTKIVIVSDHGIVGDVSDSSSRAKAGGTTDNTFVKSRSALLVKGRDAKGRIRISEEFVPNAEVPRIVCEEIGGCVNPYLGNKTIEAHGRDQPFLVDLVPWQYTEQRPTRFNIDKQLKLTNKDPYDRNGWIVPKGR
jgi:hypothetical protein